jgi:DnaJ homolog subfamily C member 28
MLAEETVMDHVEKIIQRAQEQGYFDNLPGAGKPQDLSENPFVPEDWRMAFRLLKSNGFAPDTVEHDKALRAELASVDTALEAFGRRWDRWIRTSWDTPEEREEHLAARERFLVGYEQEQRALNHRVHAHNARAPQVMQIGALAIAQRLAAARARLAIPD